MESNISFSDSLITKTFSLSRPIRFFLILIVNMSSSMCSFLLLYHLFTKRILRIAIHNHMLIVLLLAILVVQLIDMPLYLKYLYLGFVWPQTAAMCFTWWYIDMSFYDTIVILLAWTSFERHILIFHRQLISTRKKIWLFHYFPMIFFLIYPLTFYLLVLFIPSCDNKYLFNYTRDWCNYQPCYYNNKILDLYDTLMNAAIPCFLIALFSIALVIRVLWTKYVRFRRPIQWRKYRRMTVQLSLIASVFVIFNLPLLIYYVMSTCGSLPTNADDEVLPYFLFSANFSVLLLPFVIVFSFPRKYWQEEWQKIKRTIQQRENVIDPR